MKESKAWYIGLSINVLLVIILATATWYFSRPSLAQESVEQTPVKVTIVPPKTVPAPLLSKDKLYPLINLERINAGLAPLTTDPLLEQSACLKAQDMVTRNYWSHNTPDGTEPWVFFDQVGYNYVHAGENLLYGYYNNESAVRGWMNSPLHKENIVGDYYETGLCVLNNIEFQGYKSTNLVVQHFGTR